MKTAIIAFLFGMVAGGGWGYILGDSKPTKIVEQKNEYFIELAHFYEPVKGTWVLNPEDVEEVK